MASAAGVAGVRATLDLGSKSFKCVQCGEPDSARITRYPEVGLFGVNLTYNALTFLVTYGTSSALSRWNADYPGKWIPDTGAFIGTNQGALLPNCPSSISWDLWYARFNRL
jgi:hypothetical protein